MSSGELPLLQYHRANALGSGAYGSVLTVFSDEGEQFALKLFNEEDSDDEDEEEDYEEEEEEEESEEEQDDDEDEASYEEEEYYEEETRPMDLGALREISILRILRHENAHPNIIEISDVKQPSDIDQEEDGDVSMKYHGICMPLYSHGTMTDIINMSSSLSKKTKVEIAHGLLCAIAHLHHNGIIHRDIKSDNIMMDMDENGNYKSVLIDFSLAKVIVPSRFYKMSTKSELLETKEMQECTHLQGENTLSPSVGTPTYRAPECIDEEKKYGLPSDMYSIGVVLLELLRGSCIEAFKDKTAVKIVNDALSELPDQPFANLVRRLLEKDPLKRMTAKMALEHPLFEKFQLNGKNHDKTFRSIHMCEALPLEVSDLSGLDKKMIKKRIELIQKIASDLDAENPMTTQAALCYSLQLSELDDCLDNLSESQGLVDCVVLAGKFFEKELWDLSNIEELDRGVFKKCDWSQESYIDTESTLWMMMDFCLYPRELLLQ